MIVIYSTLIPNKVLDDYLPNLKLNELKVLLIVLRQTIGFHKDKDWISSSQMEKKTGLSRRSISHAIDSLLQQNLITVTDDNNTALRTPQSRKGRQRIFFGSSLIPSAKKDTSLRNNCAPPAQNLRTTKDIFTNNCYEQKSKKPKNVEFVMRNGERIARYYD